MTTTRIGIVGAGAIGCVLGGRLAQAGYTVSLLARGEHLRALQRDGLRLSTEQREWHGILAASDRPADLGEQDVLLVCTKNHQIPSVVANLAPMMHEATPVVFAINGLPWWFFHGFGGEYEGRNVQSLDPEAEIATHIDPARVIGCVTYQAARIAAPGVVEYVPVHQRELVIGEPSAANTQRLVALHRAFTDAGFDAHTSPRIRDDVWDKLWGNSVFNTLSALTHATMDALASDPEGRELLRAGMQETAAIGERLGIRFHEALEARIDRAGRIKGHKASTLQDVEQGRKTEVEALVGALREIAGWLEMPTPTLDMLYHLTRLKERFYAAVGT